MDVVAYLNNDSHGQDQYLVGDHIVAVMDGTSDSFGADTPNALAEQLKTARDPNTVLETINRVHEEALNLPYHAMSTVAAALNYQDRWHVFSVGDSPIYHLKGGKLELALPMDSHPFQPNVIMQAVGAPFPFEIHHGVLDYDGQLLLMSDGFADNLSVEDLESCLTPTVKGTYDNVLAKLAEFQKENKGYVYDRFKDDDQSLIVAQR